MVEGKAPADMPAVLAETFTKTISEARAVLDSLAGSGYFAPMRADEFVASRAVGADLAAAHRVVNPGKQLAGPRRPWRCSFAWSPGRAMCPPCAGARPSSSPTWCSWSPP
jgi:hypothetical protein